MYNLREVYYGALRCFACFFHRPSESVNNAYGEFEIQNGLTYQDHLVNLHIDLVNGAELSMVFSNSTNTSMIDFNSPFHEETMEWYIVRQ